MTGAGRTWSVARQGSLGSAVARLSAAGVTRGACPSARISKAPSISRGSSSPENSAPVGSLSPEFVQIVGPALHHRRALREVLRMVVEAPPGIPHRVRELQLDGIRPPAELV